MRKNRAYITFTSWRHAEVHVYESQRSQLISSNQASIREKL